MRNHDAKNVVGAMLAAAWLAMATGAGAGTPSLGYSDTSVVSGLVQPTAVEFLPDGRMLVTQQTGELVLADHGVKTKLADIPGCRSGEMGLLGLAIDPDFATNGYVYLYRTGEGDDGDCQGANRFNQVVRVTMAPDDTVSPASLTVLLSGIGTYGGNHDGGGLRVGPDHKLYVGAGDSGVGDNRGGPGSSTNPYSQDLSSLNGKVLRLNLDGTVPVDNPFVGQSGVRPEIYAYGFRNPFRLSFDDATGSLWLGDVGDGAVEEVDLIRGGGNYSWPYCEANKPAGCQQPGDVAPVFSYPHAGPTSLGSCVIGGDFAGAAFDNEAGSYVFGDCLRNRVYLARVNATRDGFGGAPVLVATNANIPSDFTKGPDGAVYYTTIGGDEVRRISRQVGDQLLIGSRLGLKADPASPSGNQLLMRSQDSGVNVGAGNGSDADPVLHGGSLRVVSTSGDGFDATYPLPAGASWSYLGGSGDNKGYRYEDGNGANGPIQRLMLKQGRLIRLSGAGAQLQLALGANPDPVGVVLSLGSQRYCFMYADGAFAADRSYLSVNAAAPGACAP